MTHRYYDNQAGVLGSGWTGLTVPAAGAQQAITNLFAAAPNFATLTGDDLIVITLDAGSLTVFEIIWLVAFTAGSKDGTVIRAAQQPDLWPPVAHAAGTGTWMCASTADDLPPRARAARNIYARRNFS